MRKSFELLKVRSPDNTVPFKEMEKKYVLTLPPIYKMFINNYAIGEGSLKNEYFKIKEDLIQFTSVTYFGKNDYENSLTYFLKESELRCEFMDYKRQLHDFNKEGFVRIGYFDKDDSLLLGVVENNLDSIWRLNGYSTTEKPYLEKIESDIFQFVKSLNEVIIEMNLKVRGVLKNNLFKNWGEDFWRVRDEEKDR